MQGREHQVAGFRGFQRDLDRLAVAHFTHQNHLGRLPQRGAQGQRERRCVAVQFALVHRGFLVIVQKFDGILDGENVNGALGRSCGPRWPPASRISPSPWAR